jgi:hypothetical protein
MTIEIETYAFVGVATRASGPKAQVWLPPGYTLTGGGAYDLGRGPGNVLTASFPMRNQHGQYTGWAAAGRDLGQDDPAPLAVYAIGLRIMKDGVPVEIEQQVFCATSALVNDPGVSVKLGAGWIGTGGGAQDNYVSPASGNMLTESFPMMGPDGRISGWTATGKDLDQSEGARVTAFVIGIKPIPGITLDASIISNSSLVTAYPSASVSAPVGDAVVVGGGAFGTEQGCGHMLSASCPVISGRNGRLTGWFAARKEQRMARPGPLTAYVVMLGAAA